MQTEPKLQVVTGAFGYSGRYIAAKLLAEGVRVRTLTNSPRRHNPFGQVVEVHQYHFNEPELLVESLRGATVLYNTYWVRFNSAHFTFADAVKHSLTLFDAAKQAGVQRVVHVSITNPSEDLPLEYFHGKAVLERALIDSGLSYAILRPAVLFGEEDILINNIAWALRRLPVFGVFGDGKYCLQPIYVDDLAELAAVQGRLRENAIIDAIGPETFSYRDLVQTIGKIIGHPRPMISLPPPLAYLFTWLLGKMTGDVIVTPDEIKGLMQNLLCTDSPSAGHTKFTDWAREHADALGRHYASELARRRNRTAAYREL